MVSHSSTTAAPPIPPTENGSLARPPATRRSKDNQKQDSPAERAGTPPNLAATTGARCSAIALHPAIAGPIAAIAGPAAAIAAIAKHSGVDGAKHVPHERGDAHGWEVGAEGRRVDDDGSLFGPTLRVAGANRADGGNAAQRKQVERNAILRR